MSTVSYELRDAHIKFNTGTNSDGDVITEKFNLLNFNQKQITNDNLSNFYNKFVGFANLFEEKFYSSGIIYSVNAIVRFTEIY